MTLSLIHTMSLAGEKDRSWLRETFRSGRAGDAVLHRVREMVQRYGSIEYSLRKAREYGQACRRVIEALKESECRDALTLLPEYVVQRVH